MVKLKVFGDKIRYTWKEMAEKMWKLSLEKVQPPRFGFIQINLWYFLFFVVKVFATHKLFDLLRFNN